jgi:hypothetical protein
MQPPRTRRLQRQSRRRARTTSRSRRRNARPRSFRLCRAWPRRPDRSRSWLKPGPRREAHPNRPGTVRNPFRGQQLRASHPRRWSRLRRLRIHRWRRASLPRERSSTFPRQQRPESARRPRRPLRRPRKIDPPRRSFNSKPAPRVRLYVSSSQSTEKAVRNRLSRAPRDPHPPHERRPPLRLSRMRLDLQLPNSHNRDPQSTPPRARLPQAPWLMRSRQHRNQQVPQLARLHSLSR